MGINRVKGHRGKTRIQVSKRWPDGSGFRRYFPIATVAKNTLTRIEAAIVQGVWQELKEELLHADRLGEISVPTLVTVGRFDSVILSCSETLHRGIAGAQMEIFEASAHLVPLEESERYLDVVRKFLRQTERHDL